jgi:hypothetical protein
MSIHGGTSHPTPGSVRLVSALLINSDWSRSHIAQFKPAQTRHPAGVYAVGTDNGFMITEIPISEAKHQTIADAVEII